MAFSMYDTGPYAQRKDPLYEVKRTVKRAVNGEIKQNGTYITANPLMPFSSIGNKVSSIVNGVQKEEVYKDGVKIGETITGNEDITKLILFGLGFLFILKILK